MSFESKVLKEVTEVSIDKHTITFHTFGGTVVRLRSTALCSLQKIEGNWYNLVGRNVKVVQGLSHPRTTRIQLICKEEVVTISFNTLRDGEVPLFE